VHADGIITSLTGDEIYEIPLSLEKEGLAAVVLRKLNIQNTTPDLAAWRSFKEKAGAVQSGAPVVTVGIVGKYKPLAYVSISEALFYSAVEAGKSLKTVYIASDGITDKTAKDMLKGLDGIVVPSGFGERGFSGKAAACEYARKNNLPALMIGFGAQAAVCGFLNAVCGVKATSAEFGDKSKEPAIRRTLENGEPAFILGARESRLVSGTRLHRIYGSPEKICERRRHKYEINPFYKQRLEENGLKIAAESPDGVPEAFELDGHPFYIGVAFRPEFKARLDAEHPLFREFIGVCAR
jgi:CTP synthase